MLVAIVLIGFAIVIFQLAALRILFVDMVKQLRMLNFRAERGDGLAFLSVEEEAQTTIDRDAGLVR